MKQRLVVVEQVYCGTVADHRFARWLESDEEPYGRTYDVGAEWRSLDTGWVQRPSMLTIRNDGKEAVLLSLDAHVPFAAVRPGESARFEPRGPLYLRGPGRIRVVAYPE